MITIKYKNLYIHCYCDTNKCHVRNRWFKSLHAAKIAITKGFIP